MSALAAAVVLLRAYQERMAAEMIVMEAVAECGDVAELHAKLEADCERLAEECQALEDRRDLLKIEVAMLLKQARQRAAGGPGEKEK